MNRKNIEYIIWGNDKNFENASKELTRGILVDQMDLLSELHDIGSQRNFDNIAWQNLLVQKHNELKTKLSELL